MRSRAKFTRGDWLVRPELAKDRLIIGTKYTQSIADVYCPYRIQEGMPTEAEEHVRREWLANAYLISNAPRMYELLTQVHALVVAEHLMNKYVVGNVSPLTEELMKSISKVLRQVETCSAN